MKNITFKSIKNNRLKEWVNSIDFKYEYIDEQLLALYNEAKKHKFTACGDSSEYPSDSLRLYFKSSGGVKNFRLCLTNIPGIFFCEFDDDDNNKYLSELKYGRILFDNVLKISSKRLSKLRKDGHNIKMNYLADCMSEFF